MAQTFKHWLACCAASKAHGFQSFLIIVVDGNVIAAIVVLDVARGFSKHRVVVQPPNGAAPRFHQAAMVCSGAPAGSFNREEKGQTVSTHGGEGRVRSFPTG